MSRQFQKVGELEGWVSGAGHSGSKCWDLGQVQTQLDGGNARKYAGKGASLRVVGHAVKGEKTIRPHKMQTQVMFNNRYGTDTTQSAQMSGLRIKAKSCRPPKRTELMHGRNTSWQIPEEFQVKEAGEETSTNRDKGFPYAYLCTSVNQLDIN